MGLARRSRLLLLRSRCSLTLLPQVFFQQIAQRQTNILRHALDADARGHAHHGRDRRAVRHDVDLLTQQEPRIDVVDVDGSASEGFNEMFLYGREPMPAAAWIDVFGYALGDRVELLGRIGASIKLATAEQLRPRPLT